MATELIIRVWCDVCAADGEHIEGEPVEVTLNGATINGRTLTLDLCDRDRKAIVGPLEDALAAYGRKPEGQAPKRRGRPPKPPQEAQEPQEPRPSEPIDHHAYPFRCLYCGHETNNSGAMSGHYKLRHGVSMSEVYGSRCPACGVQMGSSGMGNHLVSSHHIRGGVAIATAWARANGDPHGVAAEILARVP